MNDAAFRYEGSELALFAEASHWKRYYARSLRPFTGPAVLEVGAGIGGTTQVPLRRAASPLGVSRARRRSGRATSRRASGPATFRPSARAGWAHWASLPDGDRFDTVIYIDVLEHIERDREELEQAVDHLNPGGHLVILAPAHQWLWSRFDTAVGHHRRYSRTSLLELGPIGNAGRAGALPRFGRPARLTRQSPDSRNALPTARQIRVWDDYMVPCSRILDPVFGYNVGKTVVVVRQRP